MVKKYFIRIWGDGNVSPLNLLAPNLAGVGTTGLPVGGLKAMYQYDQHDQTLVDERVAQFRGQVRRYLDGELSDDEFRPLRLMNGLYIQRHAPMLRVALSLIHI